MGGGREARDEKWREHRSCHIVRQNERNYYSK